jgi:ABC-type glycerol-3-phosphate transport system permease component
MTKFFKIIGSIIGIAFFVFTLIPFIWTFYCSFRTSGSLSLGKFWTDISDFTFGNYISVFSSTATNLTTCIINSFITATAVTIISLFVALITGYVLTRFRLKGRNAFIIFFLSGQMFPLVLVLIPLFQLLNTIGLINTLPGLILTHIVMALPFSIWLTVGYMTQIPRELDEAAMIDGLGWFGCLVKIVLPLALPAIAVVAFYSFMVSWGDYLFASIISQEVSSQTLPYGIATFMSSSTSNLRWGSINAAIIVSVTPTTILFMILKKWIIEGLTSGAVKG